MRARAPALVVRTRGRHTQQPQEAPIFRRRPSVSSDSEEGLRIERLAGAYYYNMADDEEKKKIAPSKENKKRAMTVRQVKKMIVRDYGREDRRLARKKEMTAQKTILKILRRAFNNRTHYQNRDPATPDEMLVKGYKFVPHPDDPGGCERRDWRSDGQPQGAPRERKEEQRDGHVRSGGHWEK